MADRNQYQARWKSKKKLKEILARWRTLKKSERTMPVLLFATDSAGLNRAFVAKHVNDMLAIAGEEPIPESLIESDAGDE